MNRLSPKACLLFPDVSADVLKAHLYPESKLHCTEPFYPSWRQRMLLSGSLENMFNISPQRAFSPLSESIQNCRILPKQYLFLLEVTGRREEHSLAINTHEELEAECTMEKLLTCQGMSHRDTTKKSLLQLLLIFLSVVIFIVYFFKWTIICFITYVLNSDLGMANRSDLHCDQGKEGKRRESSMITKAVTSV